MATYGRVSVVLAGFEAHPAGAEYDYPVSDARAQARRWTEDPGAAGSVVAATWEWVRPDGSTLVLMWERGRVAEFVLPGHL